MKEIFKQEYFEKWYPDWDLPDDLATFCNRVVEDWSDDDAE